MIVYAAITASSVTTASGELLTRGSVSFSPVDGNGNPAVYTTPSGIIVPETITRQIMGGTFAQPLMLLRSDSSTPPGIAYRAVLTDGGTGETFPLGTFSLLADSFDLSQIPSSAVLPSQPPASTPGTPGTAATITVGIVTGLAPGATPTITNAGTPTAAVFNFGIPAGQPGTQGTQGVQGATGLQGLPGKDGATPALAVASTTTGAPGTQASVTLGGTQAVPTLAFTIPAGATGLTGATGATGSQGSPGTAGQAGAAATVTVGTTTTGAPGSQALVTNTGTAQAAVLNFTVPQGPAGTAGTGGSGGLASVGDLTGFFTSTTNNGAVSYNFASVPTVPKLNVSTRDYNVFTAGDPTQDGYFVISPLGSLFGMLNHDRGIYYGLSATPNSPPANWAVLTGYFNGFGVQGLSGHGGDPLFAVARTDEYLGNVPGYQKLSFSVGGNHDVRTYNSILDDGSGNACISGKLFIGAADPYSGKPTQSSGAGAPTGGEPNGSLYQRTDGGGAANTTIYARVNGAWVGIA